MTGSIIAISYSKYGKLLKGREDQLMLDNNEIAEDVGDARKVEDEWDKKTGKRNDRAAGGGDQEDGKVDYIGKLYLDPIHLADPGSTWSTPIHSGVLLIHLRVPQLALPLIRSNQEPVFWSRSNCECPGWFWPCSDLIKIQSLDRNPTLSAPADSGLYPRSSLGIAIQLECSGWLWPCSDQCPS